MTSPCRQDLELGIVKEMVEEDEDEGEEGEWVILMGIGMLKLGVVLSEL